MRARVADARGIGSRRANDVTIGQEDTTLKTAQSAALKVESAGNFFLGTVNTETLTGDRTLAVTDKPIQFLDPGGLSRNVDLPPELSALFFWIINRANAAETLTVREDGGVTTIATIDQDENAIFISDGTNWASLVGTST